MQGFLKHRCPPITVIPNGIDPPPRLPPPAELPHPNVLFLGKTDYPPNRAAIKTLISEWIPAARDQGLTAHPVIVGGPTPAGMKGGTLFTGYVEDIWPFLSAADICVAPLKSGSGTRIKVLDYLAAEKPIIASGVAVEGLGLKNGIHYLQADASSEFVNAFRRLMNDQTLQRTLTESGKEIAHGFLWPAIAARWGCVLQEIVVSGSHNGSCLASYE
jgi:glycosyltransferase involved in cell wall biosynthesis